MNLKETLHLVVVFSLAVAQQESLYFPNEEETEYGQVFNRGDTSSAASSNPPPKGTSAYESYVDNVIANGISKLSLSVNRLLMEKSAKNVIFAPVSITGALALVLLGSNGKTFKEIIDVMGLTTGVTDIQDRSQVVHEQFGRLITKLQSTSGFQIGSQVVFGSAIFVQNTFPIRSLYKQTAEELYESEILNVDFQSNPTGAQKVINNWVSERTNGKINSILDESPSVLTKIIITTAMYFKAEWEYPFFEGTTQKRPFYPNGRKFPSTMTIDMMSNGGYFPYFRDQTLGCEIIGFPYKGNRSSMYVVMPFDSDPTKLKQFEKLLKPADMERLVASTVSTSSVVLFPRMRIESTIDLREVLQNLGVRSLFNPSEANLALLSPGGEENIATDPAKNRLSNAANEGLFLFSRGGMKVDCNGKDKNNMTACEETTENGAKKTGSKSAREISTNLDSRISGLSTNTLDNIRQLINQQNPSNNYQNPGLYADKIIHKVYMDITETGTEAAAATSVSLSRDGSRVTFRADCPFLFFIWHEETKVVTFWGSVNVPTPNYRS